MSSPWRVVRIVAACVIVPAALVVIGLLRLSFSIAGSVTAARKSRSNWVDFRNDFLAYTSADYLVRPREVPITTARIRDASGRIIEVRCEGNFISGALAIGDDVELSTVARNATLLVVRGQNNTLGVPIALRA